MKEEDCEKVTSSPLSVSPLKRGREDEIHKGLGGHQQETLGRRNCERTCPG